MIESDGAALFDGLIDPSIFEQLVAAYDKVLLQSGNNTFMHSYVNLAEQLDFLQGGSYVDAFGHPLLIALISYLMGGPIRMVDFRGENTDPISINAQDNMFHVDNTPFKEEYKVLLNWRRGKAKGPSGQNFTFLPWTHKGNRDILVDDSGLPWSTERDSLFVSHEAINGLFKFQKETQGISRVVEATHPEQPLAILFPAGALVHHRYRTEVGDPRSCIITAYHLSSKHPGHIVDLPPICGRKKTLIEFFVGHQDENSHDDFLDVLFSESQRIEDKIQELFQPSHPSTLLDLEPLALKGERLSQWRDAVVAAPSPLMIKLNRNLHLSGTEFSSLEELTEMLPSIMIYDKHGLLQMILYEDGREEIRKPARKLIGEMKKDAITTRLRPWTPQIRSNSFSAHDLVDPKTLKVMCEAVASLASNLVQVPDAEAELTGQQKMFKSLSRLMLDLGEAIVRCESVETFVATSLFLFWTSEEIYSHMRESDQLAIRFMLVVFLRNYVASVLLVESTVN